MRESRSGTVDVSTGDRDVPECTNGLALKKPDQSAGFGVMRHVKQIACRHVGTNNDQIKLLCHV